MLFPTIDFAIFFFVVFFVSWAAHHQHLVRKLILLAASYIFYAFWDWRFVALLAECSVLNYLLALWLANSTGARARKAILSLGVVLNLSILVYFKYSGFMLASLRDALAEIGWERDWKIVSVLLPAGISFFCFQGISYLVDIYRQVVQASRSPVDVLLYFSFFPHLIAGPIVRAADFLPQIEAKANKQTDHQRQPTKVRFVHALGLITLGIFKKVIIAHYLATELVNPVFAAPRSYGSLDVLMAVYAYAFQIYCDFSAYSDMACGLAALLGIEFPRNFLQPYRASSLQDFWRRWHISLSSWLRDYLYIPLGGSQSGRWKTYRNLLITMGLGGLWHGAAWNFVIWGLLHGAGLCGERAWRHITTNRPSSSFVVRVIKTILVFHFICFCWVFFVADSLNVVREILTALVNWQLKPQLLATLPLSLLLLAMLSQFMPHNPLEILEEHSQRWPIVLHAGAFVAIILIISAWAPSHIAPFIYFRF